MSRKQLTQYDITHMENLTVRDEYWTDRERDSDDWREWEYEDDEVDD